MMPKESVVGLAGILAEILNSCFGPGVFGVSFLKPGA